MKKAMKTVGYIIVPVLVGAITIGTMVFADGNSNIKSVGNIDFDNGTVVFKAEDLTNLEKEISTLEADYKQHTLDGLNAIGTYFDATGTPYYVETADRDVAKANQPGATAISFTQLQTGIDMSQYVAEEDKGEQAVVNGNLLFYKDDAASDSKDLTKTTDTDTGLPVLLSPAMDDNLTAGTAAYVNGELILGTGTDNNSYYNMGYMDGFNKATDSVDIEYHYHKHVDGEGNVSTQDIVYSLSNPGGCYVSAGHTHNQTGTCASHQVYHAEVSHTETVRCSWSASGQVENGGMLGTCPNHPSQSYCNDVGGGYYVAGCNGTKTVKIVDSAAYYETVYDCGSPVNTWKIGCGKNTSTIDSATVIFR